MLETFAWTTSYYSEVGSDGNWKRRTMCFVQHGYQHLLFQCEFAMRIWHLCQQKLSMQFSTFRGLEDGTWLKEEIIVLRLTG